MGSGRSKISPFSNAFKSRRRSIILGQQRLLKENSRSPGQKTKHSPTQAVLYGASENISWTYTIDILPADVLVKIFDYYRRDSLVHWQLGDRPWKWLKLAHVCKTWRSVLFASSHDLDLQLFFTYGMPIREILNFWPAFPIAMHYVEVPGSNPPTPSDQDNIVALRELPTRLRDVQLTVTFLLMEKISTLMQQSFPVLEYLHVSTLHTLVLPIEFGSGMSHLRGLCTDGFALPAVPQILLSAHELVSLRLDKIPTIEHTLEALVISLPALMQLETLHICFQYPTFCSDLIRTNRDRILPYLSVLPALNSMEFHGTSDYLEFLLSGISAPRLVKSQISFFEGFFFDSLHLGRFISHSTIQQFTSHATIHSTDDGISIILTGLESPHRISLSIPCNQLRGQFNTMAGVCNGLSPTLADVEQLKIIAPVFLLDGPGIDRTHHRILDILRRFHNVKRLCVTDRSLALVSGALGLYYGRLGLPELQVIETMPSELTDAQSMLEPFIVERWYSSHPVVIRSSTLHSPSRSPISACPWPPPRIYTPFYTQRALLYTSLSQPIPRVCLHVVLAAPGLLYDMRYHPNQSNLRLSGVFADPARIPPVASLQIRVPGIPSICTVRHDRMSATGNVVTVEDVLVCLYLHLHEVIKTHEYRDMEWASKAEYAQVFERYVKHDSARLGPEPRRVDILGDRFIAQGLVLAQSKDELWDVKVSG